jgi:type II secretion system protein N
MPILGYTLFALLLFYLFFLYQFPYEGVKKAIIQSVAATLPIDLSIEKLRPSFPWQLHLEKINIRSGTFLIQIPDLRINPNPINFILGKTNFYVTDWPLSQRLQGEFLVEKNQNHIKIQLNNLEIKAYGPEQFSFAMKLSGETTLQWVGENFGQLKGQAWVLLQKGEMKEISNLPLPLLLTSFETVRAEIQIQEGILGVKRLVASGKDMKEIVLKDIHLPISILEKGEFPDLSLFSQLPPK